MDSLGHVVPPTPMDEYIMKGPICYMFIFTQGQFIMPPYIWTTYLKEGLQWVLEPTLVITGWKSDKHPGQVTCPSQGF